MFEEQAERTPDAVAVVFPSTGSGQDEDEQITYRELNTRANRLAHHLISIGVGPEVPVGICMERSAEMITALMGILKAGGAYLPMNPEYPGERLAYMSEDAGIRFLVTREHLREKMPEGIPHKVCPDSARTYSDRGGENPASRTVSGNAAYIIYTSGSAGKPKGVIVTHRSLVNLSHSLCRAAYRDDDASCRATLNGPLSFDTSVKQVIRLLSGHALHIVPESVRSDPRLFVSFLREKDIHVLDCTPSLLGLLLSEGGLGDSELPLTVLVGGEAVDGVLWRNLSVNGTLRCLNLYGPTECTADASICPVTSSYETPVIGKPLDNTRIYVVGSDLRPVPAGVPGELLIGGAGVGRGYSGRPDLTAGKFIPGSFGEEPGSRLYRTGDICRYLPDSSIEFLGRTDHQVKIRGFRIEPGEIGAALSEHPNVKENVVIAREHRPGDRYLAAYIVGDVPDSELREHLRKKLPDYMIPAHFVFMESLPLTPNGKIDRRSLPGPGQSPLREDFIAPGDSLEEKIASVWAGVLDRDRIGIRDNFFDLGGHSLLGMQVISRIHRELSAEVGLRELFAGPTVSELARIIRTKAPVRYVPIRPVPEQTDYGASHTQRRMWVLHNLDERGIAYNISGAWIIRGTFRTEAFEKALGTVIGRHESLRTGFVPTDSGLRQVIHRHVPFSVIRADMTEEPNSEKAVKDYGRRAATTSFDLSEPPLLRAHLLRLTENRHGVVIVVHHIISDGWSLRIFVRELSELYRAYSVGRENPLPPWKFSIRILPRGRTVFWKPGMRKK